MRKEAFVSLALLLLGMASCKPTDNKYNTTDPRLQTNTFCNDPAAVNFNWGFPGRPDSSVCVYPSDLYKGRFSFRDSVYDQDGYLDSAASQNTYALVISTAGKNAIRISGFCATTLTLTAPRTGFQATLDTNAVTGQIFCRPQDTVSGTITRAFSDTTQLQIQFTVYADTSVRTHRGTAVHQP